MTPLNSNVLSHIQMRLRSPVKDKYSGLCHHLLSDLKFEKRAARWWLEACFRKWPEFSGNVSFPVKHDTMPLSTAYYFSEHNLWDRRTKYGQARWRLMAFIQRCVNEEWVKHEELNKKHGVKLRKGQ